MPTTTFKKGDYVQVEKENFHSSIKIGNVFQIVDVIKDWEYNGEKRTGYVFKNIFARWRNVENFFKKITKEEYDAQIETYKKNNKVTNGLSYVFIRNFKRFAPGFVQEGFEKNLYPLKVLRDEPTITNKSMLAVQANGINNRNYSFWLDDSVQKEAEIIVPYDYEIPKELLGNYILLTPLKIEMFHKWDDEKKIIEIVNELNKKTYLTVQNIEFYKTNLIYTIKGCEYKIINFHHHGIQITKELLENFKKEAKNPIKIEKELKIEKTDFENFMVSEHNKILEEEKKFSALRIEELERNVKKAQASIANSELEIQRLNKHPKVKKLKIENGTIYIETDVLECNLGKYGTVPLGPYRLHIRNQKTSLKMYGYLIKPITDVSIFPYAHPCIKQDNGDICFGNQADFVITLGREYKLYDMVMMFINLIESEPGSTPFCNLDNFYNQLPLRTKLITKFRTGGKK